VITESIESMSSVGAPATWVLSNHDVVRHPSRYSRPQPTRALLERAQLFAQPADMELGMRRARAAILLMLALPGSAYIYQGEELGLPEVEDIPEELLQDPVFKQSGGEDRGRDGCRVPLPWSGDAPPFGFSPPNASAPPWLPQPASWRTLSVEHEEAGPGSMLHLYRTALRLRHAVHGGLTWDTSDREVLSFHRADGFQSVTNLSSRPIRLPAHTRVLLSSAATRGDMLPSDATVWLET
jgi:alpha-glucosidase